MYISTRNNYSSVSASKAIQLGMVPSGGLFVPENIPKIDIPELESFRGYSYQQLAEKIFTLFLKDFGKEEIRHCVQSAYNSQNFLTKKIAPLKKLDAQTFILELWHGPTAAFKDMALQILPHLLNLAILKTGILEETIILVATSGDTGKAALEGFKNVPGIRIIVFYPEKGVSKIQELQMLTTEGTNTHVVAVKGNFDDCQNEVKRIFGDQKINNYFRSKGYVFSSANSINWGRLLPQIVYYFWSYLQLMEKEKMSFGQKVNFVVPTGNFGNILAAWYAFKMGLPVNRLLCASNENKVLTDFFKTGVYDRQREFKQTNSPSMDILVSSNLERFLFELSDRDGGIIKQWMNDLEVNGKFKVNHKVKLAMDEIIFAAYADNRETLMEIKAIFEKTAYTLDTHTAVAFKVYREYLARTNDQSPTIIDATASPFKFGHSVLEALKGREIPDNQSEFEVLQNLSLLSQLAIHPGLYNLENKEIRHFHSCIPSEIELIVQQILGVDGTK